MTTEPKDPLEGLTEEERGWFDDNRRKDGDAYLLACEACDVLLRLAATRRELAATKAALGEALGEMRVANEHNDEDACLFCGGELGRKSGEAHHHHVCILAGPPRRAMSELKKLAAVAQRTETLPKTCGTEPPTAAKKRSAAALRERIDLLERWIVFAWTAADDSGEQCPFCWASTKTSKPEPHLAQCPVPSALKSRPR